MSGIGTGRARWSVSAVAAIVLTVSPWVAAGDIKPARALKPTLRSGLKLPGSVRPIPSPIDVGLEAVVGPTTLAFEGLNFVSNSPVSSFYWTRPTPDGAVGPNHVVSLTPGAITWHSKAGVLENSPGQRLALDGSDPPTAIGSFFASLSPVTDGSNGRVIYDQYSGRFVVLLNDWLATGAGDPTNASSILLAVSDDSDPNGTWHYHKLNTALSIGGVNSFSYRFSASVGPDAIFVTVDFVNFAFTAYTGSRLFIIQKTPLYTGGAAVVGAYDPGIEGGFEEEIFGLTPVQRHGPVPDGLVTFLVTMDYITGNAEPAEELYGIIEVDGTSTAPVFPQNAGGFYLLGDFSNSAGSLLVPQQGTTKTINADGPQPITVWRGDDLWTVFTNVPKAGTDAGQPTVHWVNLNFVTGEFLQGDIGGEDIVAGARTYYPSINVNSIGSVAISFMASGPNLYPGAYYTGRLATDPVGTWSTPRALAAGVSYYYRVFGGADSGNGLGPTSATQVDPASDTFWTYNSYAGSQGHVFDVYPTQNGRWGTRWGSFAITGAPGDFNLDGFVDAVDVERFGHCITGPAVIYGSVLPSGCDFVSDPQGIISADFDRDGDVDMSDWGIIQRCFDPTAPAPLDCAN